MSETTLYLLGIALSVLHFQTNLFLPYVSPPSGPTDRYTLRNFSCTVITYYMSVAVSKFGAEWLLGGSVLCTF